MDCTAPKKPSALIAYLPIGENPGCFPSTHQGSKEAHDQSWAVKEHVESIWDQAQTIGQHAIEQLHKGKKLKRFKTLWEEHVEDTLQQGIMSFNHKNLTFNHPNCLWRCV